MYTALLSVVVDFLLNKMYDTKLTHAKNAAKTRQRRVSITCV